MEKAQSSICPCGFKYGLVQLLLRGLMIKLRIRDATFILVVSALVVAADLALLPIFNLYNQDSTATLVYDFSIVFLTGLAGVLLAPRVNCPVWLRKSNASSNPSREISVPILLGLSLVAGNTLIQLISINQAVELAPWLTLLTPQTAIAISLRAALNEETIFRLFLFPLVAWIVARFKQSPRASLIVGALASTVAFGLIHPPSGFLLSFIAGIIFIYIYHQRGVAPAMAAHFFTDAIPLVLTSIIV